MNDQSGDDRVRAPKVPSATQTIEVPRSDPCAASRAPGQSAPSRPSSGSQLAPATAGFRCGTVAIVGRPNVGKSTLLNGLVGVKISITSARPQTTRHRIAGIVTRDDAQLVFLDTPGFQTRHLGALNRLLNRTVRQTLGDADLVLMVADAQQWNAADEAVARIVDQSGRPAVLALNKIDRLPDRARLLPLLARLDAEHRFEALVPISAARGEQVERLLEVCAALLPPGEPMFGEDELTDRSERFMAAELVREKLFRLTGDELPYASTVVIEQYEVLPQLRRIRATILVERDAHKPIVLGQAGARIKRIGSEARADLERLLGVRVHLELWVKVKGGWADSEHSLRAYGYE